MYIKLKKIVISRLFHKDIEIITIFLDSVAKVGISNNEN